MKSVDCLKEEREAELWRQMLAGNSLSFEQLLRSTYNVLYHYGKKFTRDSELVKDSIQDVFLEVWEKRDVLDSGIPPRPYLLASVRRRLFRQAQRHRIMSEEDFSGYPEAGFDVEFSVEHSLIQLEEDRVTADRITFLLNKLPKRQKEAVYLRFYERLDRDEIASIMEIHPQSVSNLLQTAFKWMKTHWKAVISIAVALLFG